MPAPAASSASSVSSLRLFTWTSVGWTKVPATTLPDGAWGIDVRADGPHLVQIQQGKAHDVRTSPQGRSAVEAITFVLGTIINAPVVGEAPPAARAGRPSRSSRRLLVFSAARWQWEAAERTEAKTGDVIRLVERSGKPVGLDGKPGPAVFRWGGEAGAEVPYEVDELGPNLSDAELARQGFAWLAVPIDHSAPPPDPAPTEAAPEPPRARRRVLASPPPPARRALAAVPPDEDRDSAAAPPVPIPDLPPEMPAIDDEITQEFPNMPANRAQPTPTPQAHPDDAETDLRKPTAEEMAQVRARYDSGQVIAAVDLYVELCGYPEGSGHRAQADMMAALGRGKPQAPAKRGAGGSVPALTLITDRPIDEEERDYMARIPAEFDERAEPGDYEAAQEVAARAEVTIPPEPDYGADAYEPLADAEHDRPIKRGDVIPRYGRCVSVVQRNEVIELSEAEREAFVVELTEIPSLFGALEERRRKLMAELKEAKIALKKREIHLGDAIRTFKELRPVQVAGLIKDGWVTEIDADNPSRIFGTRKPNENDQLQEDLFDRRRDEDENEDDRYEGEEE